MKNVSRYFFRKTDCSRTILSIDSNFVGRIIDLEEQITDPSIRSVYAKGERVVNPRSGQPEKWLSLPVSWHTMERPVITEKADARAHAFLPHTTRSRMIDPSSFLLIYVIRGVFSFFFFFSRFSNGRKGSRIFERKGMRIMNGLLETNFLNLAEIIFSIDVFFCNVKLLR